MPAVGPRITIDPLAAFIAGALTSGAKRPVPLVSTSFDVSIDAGLAIVATKRLFRNDEPNSIEATITFPVPIHATLFVLEARLDGRVMSARAQRRSCARETYENAIERGKAGVLHEEVLRGVHMLSVGHIPPGAEVEVSTTWATTLTVIDGRGHLRIPLTVGDIYGRSGLSDSDNLLHGGPVQTAELAVRCSEGLVKLADGCLDEGRAQVGLNAPIDLVVTDWTPRDLRGRAADGRQVVLRIEPREAADNPLNVALLVDHSGSMGESCSAGLHALTKHQAAVAGLKSVARRLGQSDVVDLWQFNSTLTRIGSISEARSRIPAFDTLMRKRPRDRLVALLDRLSGPAGGTEIGRALAGVTGQSTARDVLLVTDGKSHALDVQALALTGRRFVAVLVGEDSLEANVGHLAAVTGGDIFIAAGAVLQDVVAAAFASLREPCRRSARISGELRQVTNSRGNAILSAEWKPSVEPIGDTILVRAVAAVAASLALPVLDTEAATSLAESEGLVTHLTSLVLVDEATGIQEGVPASRKIALPTPRTAKSVDLFAGADWLCLSSPAAGPNGLGASGRRLTKELRATQIDLQGIASEVDWDTSPDRLIAGDLSLVAPHVASAIKRTAMDPIVVKLAEQFRLSPVAVVVALLARAHSSRSRSASRIARATLGTRAAAELDALSASLGLASSTALKGWRLW